MNPDPDPLTRRLAAAMCEHDVLEPWLTESHWDDEYWIDEARKAVAAAGAAPTRPELRAALATVLAEVFSGDGSAGLRDDLDDRLDHIVDRALQRR